MDLQTNVLLRFDSWSRPGLKETDILRAMSLEAQDDSRTSSPDDASLSGEAILETTATLSTTQKRLAMVSTKQHKTVVTIDVHCTPGSGLEDLVQHLENPRLPTFKLADLPLSAKEDLYRIASPRPNKGFDQKEAPSLEEELARFPTGQLGAVRDASTVHPSVEHKEGSFYPLKSPLLLSGSWVPTPEQAFCAERSNSGSTKNGKSHCSDERPAKQARFVSKEGRWGPDSGSDTGKANCESRQLQALNCGSPCLLCGIYVFGVLNAVGSAGTGSRGKRLACVKCGTHQTPQWRMGPDGPRTMCNACGVKYKKELREREKRERERRHSQQTHSSRPDGTP